MRDILVVRFQNPEGNMEERTYDFKHTEARKAFIRFASHALLNGIIFSCMSAGHPEYKPL